MPKKSKTGGSVQSYLGQKRFSAFCEMKTCEDGDSRSPEDNASSLIKTNLFV
jgi:hypothetical protein